MNTSVAQMRTILKTFPKKGRHAYISSEGKYLERGHLYLTPDARALLEHLARLAGMRFSEFITYLATAEAKRLDVSLECSQ